MKMEPINIANLFDVKLISKKVFGLRYDINSKKLSKG